MLVVTWSSALLGVAARFLWPDAPRGRPGLRPPAHRPLAFASHDVGISLATYALR